MVSKTFNWYRLIGVLLMAGAWSIPVLAAPKPGTLAAAKRTIVVGFSQDTLANDWRVAQVRDLRRALAAVRRVKLVVTDGKGSTAQQIRDIEDLIDSRVDILVASPRDERAMAPVLAAAYQRGVPVVMLTRRVEGDQYTTLIAPDDDAIGRRAARHLAALLKRRGRILVLQGIPTTSTAKARTNSFLKELKRYPRLRVAAIKPANYLRADAIRAMEDVLAKKVRFDAIYAQSDSMASGARLVLNAAGIDIKKIPIVGIDYIREARSAIRRGEQSASFTYPTCGQQAAEVIARLIVGKKVRKRIIVPSRKVTKANARRVEPIF